MENQDSSSPEKSASDTQPAITRRPSQKRVIEGVAYVRDAFGCYVPASRDTVIRKIRVRVPSDALPALLEIRDSLQEVFMVLDLDGSHQIIEARKVTVGLVNQSQIHPRETFRGAIANNAVSVLVAHNHPSGNLEPSESDLAATRRLVEVGKTIGISILDHLIVSSNGFLSLRERFPAYFS